MSSGPPERSDDNRLQCRLRSRHLTMIAIDGTTGTGPFLVSGKTIFQAGPGGVTVAYDLTGLMVFFLMQSLNEMSTYLPVAGSFGGYGTRFISPSSGFVVRRNFWFSWAIATAAELAAAALVMKFWLPRTSGWMWPAIFLTPLVLFNALSARAYNEGEFQFVFIKMITVVVSLVLGVLVISGIIRERSPGFENWAKDEAPFVDGGLGVLAIFMTTGFSFQGMELVAVAAGETEDPEQIVPKAIRMIFWCVLLSYIGTIAVVGLLVSYTDPNLLRDDGTDVAYSPSTLIFDRAGIAAAAFVVNAIILTPILLAGNSDPYTSMYMLYALSHQGNAPAFLGHTSLCGVPAPALAIAAVIDAARFISSPIGDSAAYTRLVSVSGLTGLITWMGVAWSHCKFRKAFLAQGHSLDELPYRAKWYPAGPLLAMAMCVVVIVGQSYEVFGAKEGLDAVMLLSPYIDLPLFLGVWALHEITTRFPRVKSVNADPSRIPSDVHESEEVLSS